MIGYDPAFLGARFELPLPAYNPRLAGFVLHRDELTGGDTADYPNYSVVTNQVRRSPIFAALNIDLEKVEKQKTKRKSSWDTDTRIGQAFQLTNEYFADRDGVVNPWDKGHLAPRETAGWGETEVDAQKAANQTFYYSNAALQHRLFNGHEWGTLENWVRSLGDVANDRVTTFTGPVYGAYPRIKKPEGIEFAAEIPAGFFKVVCYAGTDGNLHVRSFLLLQDADALVLSAERPFAFDLQKYQVTVAEIEELTGIEFHDDVYQYNPLLHYDNESNNAAAADLNISSLPERIEVDSPEDIQDEGPRPDLFRDATKNVFIAAAMPDPSGTDAGNEWVSVINLTEEMVDLSDWWISDTKNSRKIRDVVPDASKRALDPGAAVSVPFKGGSGGLRLVNTGGAIALHDESFDELDLRGHRIDRVSYTENQVEPGRPVIFSSRPVGIEEE